MNVTEQRLETARSVFMAHRKDCKQCFQYKFKTTELKHLCYSGTILFKDMLNMENEVLKRIAVADKAAYTRSEKKRVRDMLANESARLPA